ncbi:DUF4188 domain-containing protein [Streptomyces sodiiphilus]|uniref:DUF4188 domain-containing protein n=1 Tax=Streptomyces sodiiphilus TaxID=226217 RepID=A0ABN2NRL5_9ACTN
MDGSVVPERMRAAAEGEVTVFLVGMRINSFRHVGSWWPVFRAMPGMLRELGREQGLLGSRALLGGPRLFFLVQYWASREQLLAYARDSGGRHRPAWAEFNRGLRAGRGRVGLWHETYVVPAGSHESVYIGMPPFGLGAATGTVPADGRG